MPNAADFEHYRDVRTSTEPACQAPLNDSTLQRHAIFSRQTDALGPAKKVPRIRTIETVWMLRLVRLAPSRQFLHLARGASIVVANAAEIKLVPFLRDRFDCLLGLGY